jgi:hypothetical protein
MAGKLPFFKWLDALPRAKVVILLKLWLKSSSERTYEAFASDIPNQICAPISSVEIYSNCYARIRRAIWNPFPKWDQEEGSTKQAKPG